jgi:hypothetical protein
VNDSMQLISSVESAAMFLVTFPALWISGRIILRNYAVENRALQIFLWLALGGLILTPLIDFIRYLSYVLYLIIPSSDKFNNVSVFLGMAPYLYYTTITLVLGIAVYSLAFYHSRKLVAQSKLPFIQGLQISNWEFGFVLLGIAGLVNHMVSRIVVNFVSIYIPSLTAQLDITQLFKGFWISWLIGFIILIVTLFCMSELLNRRENKLFS